MGVVNQTTNISQTFIVNTINTTNHIQVISPNRQQMGTPSSSSNQKDNPIVIEDSPSASGSVPARGQSQAGSEVIDLCGSDGEKEVKKSRKRKHPEDGDEEAEDVPTKKRKVDATD